VCSASLQARTIVTEWIADAFSTARWPPLAPTTPRSGVVRVRRDCGVTTAVALPEVRRKPVPAMVTRAARITATAVNQRWARWSSCGVRK
jgi:hypothetical protein